MTDYKQKPDSYWKEKLTPEQFAILRQKHTEPPFSGAFNAHDDVGMYVCAACGQELFSSKTKYHSGSGWPSFWQALDESKIELHEDTTAGMIRIEATCSRCGSHLGHVFDDGPNPTGQRFCINSAALDFAKADSNSISNTQEAQSHD